MLAKIVKKLLILLILISIMGPTLTLADKPSLVFTTIEGSVNAEPSKLVLIEAYQHIGMKIKVKYQPAARALITSNTGLADGEVQRIYGINKKYTNLVMVPISIGKFGGYVFTKNIEFRINGWNSLKPYKIGVVRGVMFTDKGTEGMNRSLITNKTQLFLLLDRGRIDIAVTAYLTGLHGIKESKVKGIKILRPPVQEYALYHYLHKKHADLIPKLTPILEKMEKEGKINEIWDQYAKTLQ